MRCEFCGDFLDPDNITYENRLGIATDGEDGTLIEARRFIRKGTCGRCGNRSFVEHVDYEDCFSLDYDDIQEGQSPPY